MHKLILETWLIFGTILFDIPLLNTILPLVIKMGTLSDFTTDEDY
jgi:hypothetical protein